MISVPPNPKNFSVLHNEIAQRTDLSARAKGIYYYLATLPLTWKLQLQELESHFTEGRTAINTALNELIRAGYIERQQQRNEKGEIIGNTYIGNWTVNGTVNQPTEKPFMDKPFMGNRQLLNTNKQNIKKENIFILTDAAKFKTNSIPSKDEVVAEFILQGSSEYEADKFFDYYESCSWTIRNAKITKWKLVVRSWLKNKQPSVAKKEFEIIGEKRHDEYKYGF